MTDTDTDSRMLGAMGDVFRRLGAATALPNPRSDHMGDLEEDGGLERMTEDSGVFSCLDDAVAAANEAFRALNQLSLENRFELVRVMRKAAWANADYLAVLCVKESSMGRVDSKTLKNKLVASATPGPEALNSHVSTGDFGLSLMERAPWGTVASITPVTNAATSVINHGLAMVAAGNSVVFNPHPRAARVSARALQLLNKAAMDVGGPPNLLTCCADPTQESARQLMVHPGISLLVVTGGEAVVAEGMRCGKPIIAAGPGNPPVVVDDTACIEKAARDIVFGASFDNNLVCILEKEIIAVESIADDLVAGLKKEGAYELTSWQAQRLSNVILEENRGSGRPSLVDRRWVGQNASAILREIGVEVGPEVKLIFAETSWDHPFVLTELLMPVIPVVRVSNVDEAIEVAVAVEQGFRHTAVMHSTNISNMTRMARAIDTTIFVKNGPSLAGLGHEGQGFTSMTIATPTGHGIVGPVAYTRQRRCVLVDYLRIV
ncbi:MAG: aldehyde dehydrogenase EutE [Thermoleophilia bacterium]|nr:aldehyde dehydrogenase EutE [Thermoleophilia bacterium]